MKKYNIIFMGTPDFALPPLKILFENHNVELVITQPDRVNKRGRKVEYSPTKRFALDNGIEVFQPDNINSEESIKYLKRFDVDFIVVVAYGQLIGEKIRSIPKENIVNIHASLLPKYRGAAPINRAIMDREYSTGVSIMKVDKGLDKGEVYLTSETEVSNKNYPTLYEELSIIGAKLMIEYLRLYETGDIFALKQEDKIATYAEKISKEEGALDFKDINSTIGKILGLTPRPGAFCYYKNEIIKIHDAYIANIKNDEKYKSGEIISVGNDGIQVNCENGVINITKLQFPGKKILTVKEYLAGNDIQLGEILR